MSITHCYSLQRQYAVCHFRSVIQKLRYWVTGMGLPLAPQALSFLLLSTSQLSDANFLHYHGNPQENSLKVGSPYGHCITLFKVMIQSFQRIYQRRGDSKIY